jgi:hypothetical protein
LALESHVLLLEALYCNLVVFVDSRMLSQNTLLFLGLELMYLRLVGVCLLLQIVSVVLSQGLGSQILIVRVVLRGHKLR